jgi:hypothetical protein
MGQIYRTIQLTKDINDPKMLDALRIAMMLVSAYYGI